MATIFQPEKLRDIRKRRRLTLEKLANKMRLSGKVRVTPQAISRWENGDAQPSATNVTALMRVLRVSFDDLFLQN